MMKNQGHIILGCLLHDVGKFFERAEVLDLYRHDDNKRQFYCPKNQDKYYTHIHVLHTLAFCELLSDKVPQIAPGEGQTAKNADQNWINLATYHHKPSQQDHAYLEKFVQAADRFASGEREQGNFYEQGIHKKTRMESLLGRVKIGETARINDYCLPLAAIDLAEQQIYPKPAKQFGMEEKINDKNVKAWLSTHSLVPEYKALAEKFISDLDGLQTFQTNINQEKRLKSTIRTLLTLMERYLCQVPAATNVQHPDISLFDHLRITAAIGEGLLIQHEQGNETSAYDDKNHKKWQLVCGDFSGIQKFIYKITSKGAAKGLRGRSFYIQLLCDAVSEHIIRSLGLYPTARIYSSGGKFYLLIPAYFKAQVQSLADKVNEALLAEFQGEVFLGMGFADICGDDFQQGNMGKRWQQVNEDLQRQRLRPFKAQVGTDIDCFSQQAQHEFGACKICGRDDADAGISNDQNCKQCQELETIGRVLANTRYLLWVWDEDRATVNNKLKRKLHKITLPGTRCDVYFLDKEPEFSELTDLSASHLEILNEWQGLNANPQGYSQGIRYVGKWQADKDGGSRDFKDFADNAEGISRMGVLRMDVDNLGEIFIRGLNFGKQDKEGQHASMGSLSRVATVSRQLHLFFAGYLHRIMDDFKQSQIIYAGGDDVFIIGSWHELPDVAQRIRNEFSRYCADNPCFTLSGGISVVGGRYPISRAADLAGEAEEHAKGLVRGERQKDALCFLETPIGWESYGEAVRLRDTLREIVKNTKSQAIIDRLRQVVIAVEEIKTKHKTGSIEDLIYWDKWRWRLVYNLKRMEIRYPEVQTELNGLLNQLITPQVPANK